jgi:hypothetical protein
MQSETYIVCLECGRHLGYDWTTMCFTRQRTARTPRRLGLGRISGKNDLSRGERILPHAVRLGLHRE